MLGLRTNKEYNRREENKPVNPSPGGSPPAPPGASGGQIRTEGGRPGSSGRGGGGGAGERPRNPRRKQRVEYTAAAEGGTR
jgi:hypothetical protein